ncbi:hypothetical protein [Cohnella herbarum]|uniref:Uncharacterized protein n=1 Tax=Cohnella herbarum TaxID=2728023 RepID=A0A7Z2ZP95_9BACL|nr:hypothetical protein [Cohnella herbarum]QJD86929.1 hypothetical protein HH215_29660 [Cohnella herbarum]
MNPIFELIMLNKEFKSYIGTITCDWLGDARPAIVVTYPREGMAKVRIRFTLKEDVRQDDWRVEIRPAISPTYHWSPHLTPTSEHVVDQHSFRAPALIVHDGERMLSVVPDLDLLEAGSADTSFENRTPRWYMDMDAFNNSLILGMCGTSVREHVLFVREPGAIFPRGEIEFGFYLFASEEQAGIANPWRDLLAFFWERWGRPLLLQGQPNDGELEPYVRWAYQWAFREWGSAVWQDFELGGTRVGAPVFIVNVTQSPNYPGAVNERETRSIWNQAWFSSLRSAQGLFRYGRANGNSEYVDKANQMKELALAAPQTNGFFPSVIATEMEQVDIEGEIRNLSKGWSTLYWGNSDRNPFGLSIREAPIHVLDMSWTALLMLRWHEELERDERLVDYARAYADSLLELQDEQGFFPGWIDRESFRPCGVLDQSPETSLSVTFLLKLYELTGDRKYEDSAYLAMKAVCDEIVPEGRWEDFETYWSCSRWGQEEWKGRKIARNNMYKQCNFSMFWTAEALLACYRSSGREEYLQVGQRCLDEMLMTQATWQPNYIYVPALGGFGVMNADGEWNDARQSLFAELIVSYGMELGVEEYKERGLAAMRASFTMMYCPENEKVKARWEKAWPFLNERDYGFMMENYGHGGRTNAADDPMGEFTIFDWGNGAAAEGYLRMLDRFGKKFVTGEAE